MQNDHLKIEIDGEEISDLYPELISLEVELDDEMAAMFRMRFTMSWIDGVWGVLDDPRLTVWKQVVITAGFEDNAEELLTGYITHVKPSFGYDSEQATFEIWGMDSSVLLDRIEKLKDWPNKKDSDIAAEIFQSYGLMPDVEDTAVVHDEAISTIIQRETDMQFLQRLALRNGYECYVQGSNGIFKTPQIDAESQPLLAVHFGSETNAQNFSVQVNALTPANVGMFQLERMNKETITVNIDSSELTALGGVDVSGLLPPGMEPGQVYVGMNSATGESEMSALCRGLFRKSEWFVTAQCEVNANDYAHVLLPRKPVTVKGVGETYSGVYYVNHVTHSFTAEGYMQFIKIKRNGLMLTGDENFGEDAGLLGGLV